MKPKHYAEIAAALFAAGAAFALIHRLSGGEYRHFVHTHNVIIDIGLFAIWTAGAVGALTRRSIGAFFAVIVAALVTHIHGLMFSVSWPGKGYGVPFLLASAVLPILLILSAPSWQKSAAREAEAEPEAARRTPLWRPRHDKVHA
jgi:hypothetical protein